MRDLVKNKNSNKVERQDEIIINQKVRATSVQQRIKRR